MARGKTRTIRPGFFRNQKIRALPPWAQLLFIYLWPQADRNGILEDQPGTIWRGMTGRKDDRQGERMLRLLEGAGLIRRYEVDVKGYIAIIGWYEHQPPGRGEKAKWPQPEGRAEPEDRSADGRAKVFIDHAFDTYREKFGAKLPIIGGRDSKAIKPLLKQYSLEELKGWWGAYLEDSEPFIRRQGRDIAKFVSHIARYVTGGQEAKWCPRCGGEGVLKARNNEPCPACQAGGLDPGMRGAPRATER